MSENLGPFITVSVAYVSILPAVFAVSFWVHGYVIKLGLKGKKFDFPSWMSEVTIDEEKMQQVKPYQGAYKRLGGGN